MDEYGTPIALVAGNPSSSNAVGISLALLWQPVPESLPPNPDGGWFSPMVWLALSDGRVLVGQALHKGSNAEYDAPVHDWFVIDLADGKNKSLNCLGDDLSVIAWMPLATPDHPSIVNGKLLISKT